MRDLPDAETLDFLDARPLTRMQADPGTKLLAEELVGDAEDMDILDLGMAMQELLDPFVTRSVIFTLRAPPLSEDSIRP